MKAARTRAEQHRSCQKELQLYSPRTLSSHKPRIICGSHVAKLTKHKTMMQHLCEVKKAQIFDLQRIGLLTNSLVSDNLPRIFGLSVT